jgi:dienelactone hydrolase
MRTLKPVPTLLRALQGPIRANSGGGAAPAPDPGAYPPKERKQRLRSRLIVGAALVGLLAAAAILIIALAGTGGARTRGAAPIGSPAPKAQRNPAPAPASAPYAVGLRVLPLTDASRAIHPNGTSELRPLLTYVRYPALAAAGKTDVRNAPAARSAGPFPLVIFGHGFAVTPDIYKRLLQTWARAGYVVAAPVFPLENANAPGAPDERDIVNQPADMSFVISSLLAASRTSSSPFDGLIDPTQIAVTGQSDGGDTALALAYNSNFRDPRVRAVISLSGAEIPGVGGFSFPPGAPPLLAAQGSADTVNPPNLTDTFFEAAQPPKFRLNLPGSEHLPPYTEAQPQLHIVEGVTLAFLDYYLKHDSGALKRMASIGNVATKAELIAKP